MIVETKTEFNDFVRTWKDKPQVQVVEEISSLSLETKRIPDPYYFLISQNGELVSPTAHCRIKDVIERNSVIGKLEYQAVEKIEDWAERNQAGTIAWVSPPEEDIYPTSKIIISEIKDKDGQKILFNRAIILDIDKEQCTKFAKDLASFSTNRPLLFSIDQIRSNPLILNTKGINWTYLLEELIPDLSLENIRQHEDQGAKEEALSQAEELFRKIQAKSGRVDMSIMMGNFSSSCPVVFGRPTAFSLFYNFSEKEYFECPRCNGKIPSGKGYTVCPHCGARKEDYGSCD